MSLGLTRCHDCGMGVKAEKLPFGLIFLYDLPYKLGVFHDPLGPCRCCGTQEPREDDKGL